MNTHRDDDRPAQAPGEQLSAYLDGELSAADRAKVEQWVATDPMAARLLADLRALRQTAGALPEQAPPRDLWPGIAARMEAARPAAAAVSPNDLAGTRNAQHRTAGAGAPERRPRRYALSVPQLAAAAVLLIAASSGLTAWLTTTLQRQQTTPQRTSPGIVSGEVAASFMSGRPDFAEHQYARAIRELEAVFRDGRAQMDSTTRVKLEKNLTLLDAAVVQARQALRDDPDDAYLSAHLAETMQRKLKLLRQASQLANPMI